MPKSDGENSLNMLEFIKDPLQRLLIGTKQCSFSKEYWIGFDPKKSEHLGDKIHQCKRDAVWGEEFCAYHTEDSVHDTPPEDNDWSAINFHHAVLMDSDYTNILLVNTVFFYSIIHRVILLDSPLYMCVFNCCNLLNVKFINIQNSNFRFSNSLLYGCEFYNGVLFNCFNWSAAYECRFIDILLDHGSLPVCHNCYFERVDFSFIKLDPRCFIDCEFVDCINPPVVVPPQSLPPKLTS